MKYRINEMINKIIQQWNEYHYIDQKFVYIYLIILFKIKEDWGVILEGLIW